MTCVNIVCLPVNTLESLDPLRTFLHAARPFLSAPFTRFHCTMGRIVVVQIVHVPKSAGAVSERSEIVQKYIVGAPEESYPPGAPKQVSGAPERQRRGDVLKRHRRHGYTASGIAVPTDRPASRTVDARGTKTRVASEASGAGSG